MRSPAQPFHIPLHIPAKQHVSYCIEIIEKHRAEVAPLRQQLSHCQQYHTPLLEQLQKLQNTYQQEKKEKEQWKESYDKAQQEIEELHKQIEKLTKTENRLNQSLFAHGNFHHPHKQGKKKNGGQYGHKDTNRDKQRNTQGFARQRLFATHCGKCGNPLLRVESITEKTLIDIKVTSSLIELVLHSERQWCSNCHKEVTAKSPQTLPFTEYGMNTVLMILLLRFRGNQSINNIAEILFYGFGLKLSCSVILSILRQAKVFLKSRYDELIQAIRYDELIQAIRDGEVMYNDETSWMIKGEKAYVWIMTTADKTDENGNVKEAGKTVYVAADTRGKGIFKEMYGTSKALSMHDGYASYESITGKEKSLYCWAHMLRFCYEETVHSPPGDFASQIRDRLVALYGSIRKQRHLSREEQERAMREEMESLLLLTGTNESVKNIQQRLAAQKEGLILALLETADGTNNLAEQELRRIAISRGISYGSATFDGMAVTAILSSIMQTLHRETTHPFIPTLTNYLTTGIQEKYPQYNHPVAFTS